MDSDFYLRLSDDVIELCERLIRCAEEWQLPIKRKRTFIGFGKIHGFYMFWIACKDGEHYFKARVKYEAAHSYGIIHHQLSAENKDAILEATQAIYQEYLTHGGEFQLPERVREEVPRVCEAARSRLVHRWSEAAQRTVSLWREEMTGDEESIADDDTFVQGAQEFSVAADRLLQRLGNEIHNERVRNVWQRYILNGKETLEQISVDYSLTRERIRQLARKGNREIAELFADYCAHEDGEIFNTFILPMIQILDRTSYNLPAMLANALMDWGAQKKKAVLWLLFGKAAGPELFEICATKQKEKKMADSKQECDLRVLQRLTRLQKMVRYPTEIYADTQEQIGTFVLEKEHTHIARFRRGLESMRGRLRFVQKPNIVYYSSTKTDHRPDFLLEFENGRRVLVLVLPTINMAFSYNTKRFRALRDFCEKRGYGYLIVDDRERTLEDLESLPVAPALKDALDAILMEKGEIYWSDICQTREMARPTNEEIAAYVLQSGLHFVMDPYFCIRRKGAE